MDVSKRTLRVTCLLTAAWLLAACSPPATRSELMKRDSGNGSLQLAAGPRSPKVNFISVAVPYSESKPGFSYYTGGVSNGTTAIEAPQVLVAQARYDLVGVQVKAFNNTDYPYSEDAAMRIARHVSAATREFWPQTALPVEVELHLMPDDSSYDFSRLIRWREGAPYHLTLFVSAADTSSHATAAVHEFYHVLSARWLLGSKSPQAVTSPWFAQAMEETTAALFSHCAELVAEQSLTLPASDMTITIRGKDDVPRTFKGVFSSEDLRYIFGTPANGLPAGLVTQLMAKTALKAVFGENQNITLNTPPADALQGVCKAAARDPFYLQGWFMALANNTE